MKGRNDFLLSSIAISNPEYNNNRKIDYSKPVRFKIVNKNAYNFFNIKGGPWTSCQSQRQNIKYGRGHICNKCLFDSYFGFSFYDSFKFYMRLIR